MQLSSNYVTASIAHLTPSCFALMPVIEQQPNAAVAHSGQPRALARAFFQPAESDVTPGKGSFPECFAWNA